MANRARSAANFYPRKTESMTVRDETRPLVLTATKRLRSIVIQAKSEGSGVDVTEQATQATQPAWQRYVLSTELGARGRVWDIAVLAIETPIVTAGGRVALCLHGHGSSCSAAAWSCFFPDLIAAG